MALDSLLSIGESKKSELKEFEEKKQKIEQNSEKLRQLIAYWRVYPDRFIDYLCSLNPHNTFHFLSTFVFASSYAAPICIRNICSCVV